MFITKLSYRKHIIRANQWKSVDKPLCPPKLREEFSTFNFQLSTFNFQFSIFNFQFSIFNFQFSSFNFQFSTFNFQLSTFIFHLSSFIFHLSSFSFQFSTFRLLSSVSLVVLVNLGLNLVSNQFFVAIRVEGFDHISH